MDTSLVERATPVVTGRTHDDVGRDTTTPKDTTHTMKTAQYDTDQNIDQDINWADAACASYPAMFAAEILSYNSKSPEYANLSAQKHAEMTLAREEAEAAAIDVCMGCPLLFACEKQVLQAEVYGVAAGMTAEERRNLSPKAAPTTGEDPVSVRDRSFRNRVNDDAIAVFTRMGWTNEQIAQELECTSRTVARSRARMRNTPTTTDETPNTPTLRSVTYTPTSTQPGTRTSPAMQAIHTILADGNWHHRETLLAAGAPLVTDAEAIKWFDRKFPNDTTTSPAHRIAKGARAVVDNALSASARTRARTEYDKSTRRYRAARKTADNTVRNVA